MSELKTLAQKSLQDLLDSLGFVGTIEIEEETSGICLQITSEDARFLIGEDGARLDHLQYLVNRMIQHTDPEAPRVKVDCDHYRQRTEKKLIDKALSFAKRVIETGKPMRLHPLNAYHRRLVHTALKDVKGVATESEEGSGRYKRITIRPR
jgi:spoIIIJ-associated protein